MDFSRCIIHLCCGVLCIVSDWPLPYAYLILLPLNRFADYYYHDYYYYYLCVKQIDFFGEPFMQTSYVCIRIIKVGKQRKKSYFFFVSFIYIIPMKYKYQKALKSRKLNTSICFCMTILCELKSKQREIHTHTQSHSCIFVFVFLCWQFAMNIIFDFVNVIRTFFSQLTRVKTKSQPVWSICIRFEEFSLDR